MRLHLPDEKGASKFQMLTRFSKKTGKKHPDLIPPKVDSSSLYLWRYFKDMDASRDEYRSLPHTEIQAWQANWGRTLGRWEMEVIRAIDKVWCSTYHEIRHGTRNPSDKDSNRRRN